MINLISNATKFSKRNTEIYVDVERQTSNNKKNFDCIKISVVDQGIGMTED